MAAVKAVKVAVEEDLVQEDLEAVKVVEKVAAATGVGKTYPISTT
tara:strand:- start:166 stop:300 length:135 start_codon:yes stop_codon:yes gene_type:complete